MHSMCRHWLHSSWRLHGISSYTTHRQNIRASVLRNVPTSKNHWAITSRRKRYAFVVSLKSILDWTFLFFLFPHNTGNATIPQFDDITAVLSIGAVALRQPVGIVFPNHRCTEIHERNSRIQFGTSGHLGQFTVFGTTFRRFHIRSNWWFSAQQGSTICNSNSEIIYAILWVKTFASKSIHKIEINFLWHWQRTLFPDCSWLVWLSLAIIHCGVWPS